MAKSLDRRITEQQYLTRQLLALPANAQALSDMLEWFAKVPEASAGDSHMAQLSAWAELTARLNVMSLEEHRSAVSGAFVAALFKEYPDYDKADDILPVNLDEARQQLSGVALRVAQTAVNMTPPETDIRIEHARQVDWLWMAWAVSRKKSILGRLSTLAARADEVGRAVVALFEDNSTVPEIHAALSIVRRKNTPKTAHAASDSALRRGVCALAAEVTQDLVWARRVWLVEFRNNRYYVVTDTGIVPPGCPAQWAGNPVEVRAPSKQEQQDHGNLCDYGSEP